MPGHRGAYRKGRKSEMNDTWKAVARARIESLGKTHEDIESAIGASSGQLAKMLGDQTASIYVDPLCQLLGIPQPAAFINASIDGDEAQFLAEYRDLTEEARAALRALIPTLPRRSGK